MWKILPTAVLLTLFAFPTFGQQTPCGPYDQLTGQLTEKYSEETVAIGVANGGGLIEVYANEGGETFTIIVTNPRTKQACIMSTGEGWRNINESIAENPVILDNGSSFLPNKGQNVKFEPNQ